MHLRRNDFEERLELERLSFLVGHTEAVATVELPGSSPISARAVNVGDREACDRFIRCDYWSSCGQRYEDTCHSIIGYSSAKSCYQLWSFGTSREEPLCMDGNFFDDVLIFESTPLDLGNGLERIRMSLTPLDQGGFALDVRRVTPTSTTLSLRGTFVPVPVGREFPFSPVSCL